MTYLRILYLIDHLETNYPRDQNYIIKFMMDKGHSVEVLTSRDARFEQYDLAFFPRVRMLRGPVVLQIKKAKVYFHPAMLGKLCQDYDVVHSFTFFTYSSLYATTFKSNIKIIRAEIGPPNGSTFVKARQRLYSLLAELYKIYYDYFTVFNSLETKSLELLGFPNENMVSLPPMIDFDKFSELKGMFANDSVSIGVISRISPEKGIHRIVPIMREVLKIMPSARHKFKIKMVGRIDDQDYARRILMDLRNLLGPSFAYLGEIAPPYRFYDNVDVVLVPSLTETGAITVLEAMAAGKCVLASNIPPANLYISNGLNGFLFNTPLEAARLLINILEGCTGIKSISKEAQRYAQKYDYKVLCKRLEDVYYR
ncbi:MAG: glycosyltransferase family 4 protein [Candidatus Methanosuratincola petrocarbonis]